MRLLITLLASLLLFSCTPPGAPTLPGPTDLPATLPKRADAYPGNTSLPVPVEKETVPRDPNDTSSYPLRALKAKVAGVPFTYLSFDTRTHTIAVIDQSDGPGARYPSAASVTSATKSLGTINGGFFTPEGGPLGILYHDGKKTGSLNTGSSLGSGILYVDQKNPRPVITRREDFQRWLQDPAYSPGEVLQTGPFLVENSLPTSGLKQDEARVRSLILSDGQYHFAIAQCEPITLRNLAGALAKQPLPGFHIVTALNLDGGRSADLHIPSQTSGGPINLRRWWNKPVRNYVVVRKQ